MKNLLLKLPVVTLLLLTALSGCQNPPEYPDEPNISFKRVEVNKYTDNGARIEELTFVIGFQDGDGDLGLTEEQSLESPYKEMNGKNFIIDYYIKRNGVFQPLVLPIRYDGRFFPLSPDNRIGPLEGDIRYTPTELDERSVKGIINPGDVLKFRVQIYDRALNASNIVESEEVTVFAN